MKRRELFSVLGGIVGAALATKVAAKEVQGAEILVGEWPKQAFIAPDYYSDVTVTCGKFITTGRITTDEVREFVLSTGEIRGGITLHSIPLSDLVNNADHVKKVNDFITGTSLDNVIASTFTGVTGSGVKLEARSTSVSTSLLIFNDGTMELTKSDLGKIPRFNRFKSQRAMDYITSLGYAFVQ